MGRKLNDDTKKISIKIFDYLSSSKNPRSTKEIHEYLRRHFDEKIEYSKVYQTLKHLKRKRFIYQENRGRTSYWGIIEGVDREQVLEEMNLS